MGPSTADASPIVIDRSASRCAELRRVATTRVLFEPPALQDTRHGLNCNAGIYKATKERTGGLITIHKGKCYVIQKTVGKDKLPRTRIFSNNKSYLYKDV